MGVMRGSQRQLKKLYFCYSRHAGSSKGARLFRQQELPLIAKKFPSVEFFVKESGGGHPYLAAQYSTTEKAPVVITIKNQDPEEIGNKLSFLLNRTRKHWSWNKRHETAKPSVQGYWTPSLKIDFEK